TKPKLQRFFDTFSGTYAISIILLATFFALIFPYLLHIPFLGREGSLYRALSFLIAASPCALIIAIPIAYLSAVSVCAKRGILIKGGTILDALSSCKILALDKTGTLTTGDLEVLSIKPLLDQEYSIEEAIKAAFTLEQNAVHPIAKAIIAKAKELRASPEKVENFKQIAGHGLFGIINGKKIWIGRPDFVASKLEKNGKKMLEKANQLLASGEPAACLAIDETAYLFFFKDHVRPEMKKAIEALKKNQKLEIVMLTGDHEFSAKRIAKELGIDRYYAGLTPENKLELVSEFSKNKGLAMAGDGVNDAPALARASVGICMGKLGAATAIDAADIILLHDNIEYLDWLFEKAHQTKKIVRQNLTLALLAIAVASLPALLGFIPLWLAVIMHEGGTVLVGLNALRLLRIKS
ncbi:MAG TPA: heavy metal translocating P-type ATPase, partial [Parachlamydiaceae bacterium]|nr:heavy metal translocating P-type ATPase [Parachlamydiaceae bacterium]